MHYVKSLEDFFLACKPKEEKNPKCIKKNPRKTRNSQEFQKLKAMTIAMEVTKKTMKLYNSILGLQRPFKFHTRASSQPFNHQIENFMTNEKLAIQTSETCHMTSFSIITNALIFTLKKEEDDKEEDEVAIMVEIEDLPHTSIPQQSKYGFL